MMDALWVVLGLGLLVGGGEALLRGAIGIALRARLSPTVVGLTVVAAGTSFPELVVSVQSAFLGRPDVAVGNVVGSNIFNIGAVLGLTALMRPLMVQGSTVKSEWPVMFLATCQLHLLARDGKIDRLEGGFLLLGLVAFTAYAIVVARSAEANERAEFADAVPDALQSSEKHMLASVGAVALGVSLLALGSTLLVRGVAGIATALGVSELVIALTVVAAGTSFPELVTSLVAAYRGQSDVAVANVVGSNIFNVLGILGVTASIHEVPVSAQVIATDDWWMIAAAALLFPFMRSHMRLDRWEGAVLLAFYLAYAYFLVAAAM